MSIETAAQQSSAHRATGPIQVVEDFLHALAAGDEQRLRALVADDILYVNVGLPPVRGARRMNRALRLVTRYGLKFDVVIHAISADGDVVLTDRTDVLAIGPLRNQFWVCGRFEVHDGQVVLWRDSFDYTDIARGSLRALLGAVLPRLAPKLPAVSEPPGRARN